MAAVVGEVLREVIVCSSGTRYSRGTDNTAVSPYVAAGRGASEGGRGSQETGQEAGGEEEEEGTAGCSGGRAEGCRCAEERGGTETAEGTPGRSSRREVRENTTVPLHTITDHYVPSMTTGYC